MKFKPNILFIYKLLVSISYAVNNPVGIIRTTLWVCLVPMKYE